MFYRLSDNVSSLISYLIISLYVQGKAGQWTLPRLDSGLVPDLDEGFTRQLQIKTLSFFRHSYCQELKESQCLSISHFCPFVTSCLEHSVFIIPTKIIKLLSLHSLRLAQVSFNTQYVIRLVDI